MKKNVDMYLTGKLGEEMMTIKFLDHGTNFVNVNVNYVRLNMTKTRVKNMLIKMMSKQELTTLNVVYVYFDESYLNKKFSTALGLVKHRPIKDKHVLFFGKIKTCDRVDVRRILPEGANDIVSGVKGETPSGFSITFKEGSLVPEITPFFGHVSEERKVMQISHNQMMEDIGNAMLSNISDITLTNKEVNDVEKNYIMVVSTSQRHLCQLITVNDVNKVFDLTRDNKFKEIDYLNTDKDKLNDTILSLLNKYLPKYDNVKVSNIVKVLISEDASLTLGDGIICKPINVCTFFRECQIAIQNKQPTKHVAKLPLAIIYRGLIATYLQNNDCYINVHDICTEFVFSSKKLRGKGYLVVCLELLDNSDELVFVILKPSTKEMGIKFLMGIHEIINDLGITYNKIENFKPKLVYVAKVF